MSIEQVQENLGANPSPKTPTKDTWIGLNFEPTKKNRFLVEMLGIPSYVIKSMTNLTYDNVWDGSIDGWNPVEFELYSVSGILKGDHEVVKSDISIEHRLLTYINNHEDVELNIGVKILDATGQIHTSFVLSNCSFMSADFGNKDWNSNEITIIKFCVRPKSVTSYIS